QAPTGRDRGRRELSAPGDVADGVDSRSAARLVLVRRDEAGHIERDPGLLERELLDRGPSTDRPQYAVERAETPSVARLKLELAAPGTGERRRWGVQHELHSRIAQHAERLLAQHVVEGLERRVAAQHQRGVGAETCEDAAQLDGDVAAADDCDALGPRGELEEAVRGDPELGSRNRRQAGMPAGGDHDVIGREHPPGRGDAARIDEAARTAQQLHLALREVRGVDLVEAQHVRVASLLQRSPVVPGDLEPEAVVRRIVERAAELGGARSPRATRWYPRTRLPRPLQWRLIQRR